VGWNVCDVEQGQSFKVKPSIISNHTHQIKEWLMAFGINLSSQANHKFTQIHKTYHSLNLGGGTIPFCIICIVSLCRTWIKMIKMWEFKNWESQFTMLWLPKFHEEINSTIHTQIWQFKLNEPMKLIGLWCRRHFGTWRNIKDYQSFFEANRCNFLLTHEKS
jgi:hypothetical protein